MFAVYVMDALRLEDDAIDRLVRQSGFSAFDWRQRLLSAPGLPRIVDLARERGDADARCALLRELGSDARVAELADLERAARSAAQLNEVTVTPDGLVTLTSRGARVTLPWESLRCALTVVRKVPAKVAAAPTRSPSAMRFGFGATGTEPRSTLEKYLVVGAIGQAPAVLRESTRILGVDVDLPTADERGRALLRVLAERCPGMLVTDSFAQLAKAPGVAVAGSTDALTGAVLCAALLGFEGGAHPEEASMAEAPGDAPSVRVAATLRCASCGAALGPEGEWFRFDGRDRCGQCMSVEQPELVHASALLRAQLARTAGFGLALLATFGTALGMLLALRNNRLAMLIGPVVAALLFALFRAGRTAFFEAEALRDRAERVRSGTREPLPRLVGAASALAHWSPHLVLGLVLTVGLLFGSNLERIGALDVSGDRRISSEAEGRRLLEERGYTLDPEVEPVRTVEVREVARPTVAVPGSPRSALYRSRDHYYKAVQDLASNAVYNYRPPEVDFSVHDVVVVHDVFPAHAGLLHSAKLRDGHVELVWLDVQRGKQCPPLQGGDGAVVVLAIPKGDEPVLLRRAAVFDESCGRTPVLKSPQGDGPTSSWVIDPAARMVRYVDGWGEATRDIRDAGSFFLDERRDAYFCKGGNELWLLHDRQIDRGRFKVQRSAMQVGTGFEWNAAAIRTLPDGRWSGLWGESCDDVWIGGSELVHWSDERYTEFPLPQNARVARIFGTANDNVWATLIGVGAPQTTSVLRRDGDGFKVEVIQGLRNAEDIFGFDDRHVYVVGWEAKGNRPAIATWDGSRFTLEVLEGEQGFRAIGGSSPEHLWAATLGAVYQRIDGKWQRHQTQLPSAKGGPVIPAALWVPRENDVWLLPRAYIPGEARVIRGPLTDSLAAVIDEGRRRGSPEQAAASALGTTKPLSPDERARRRALVEELLAMASAASGKELREGVGAPPRAELPRATVLSLRLAPHRSDALARACLEATPEEPRCHGVAAALAFAQGNLAVGKDHLRRAPTLSDPARLDELLEWQRHRRGASAHAIHDWLFGNWLALGEGAGVTFGGFVKDLANLEKAVAHLALQTTPSQLFPLADVEMAPRRMSFLVMSHADAHWLLAILYALHGNLSEAEAQRRDLAARAEDGFVPWAAREHDFVAWARWAVENRDVDNLFEPAAPPPSALPSPPSPGGGWRPGPVSGFLRIDRLEPELAPPGALLVIRGSGFTAGSETRVIVGGALGTVERRGADRMEVRVPANAVDGEVAVIVGSTQVRAPYQAGRAKLPLPPIAQGFPAIVDDRERCDVNTLLVRLKPEVGSDEAQQLIAEHRGEVLMLLPLDNSWHVGFRQVRSLSELDKIADELRKDGRVRGVGRNHYMHAD